MREYRPIASRAPELRLYLFGVTSAQIVAIGLGLAGCSLSIPLPGISTDDSPTGSIKTSNPSPFSAEMDGEDWRRAKSALETALDPQGNGARVAWENPQSGAKGSFAPMAQPFPKDDGICRLFQAQVALKGRSENRMRSMACRRNGGDWVVGRVTTLASQADAGPLPPARKLA